MRESSKTGAIRPADFTERFLRGRVIDIGAGNDLVCPSSERFDIEDGDANFISRYRPAATYDCVHSSHCLEHMFDPRAALDEWWALVKPAGFLIVVVPDEDLYEQGFWPPRFNSDHKHTFTLKGSPSWSPVSHNIAALIGRLPDSRIVSVEIHDHGYDHALRHHPDTEAPPWLVRKLGKLVYGLRKWRLVGPDLRRRIMRLSVRMGVVVDQTNGPALAQIQVIAQKMS